MFLRGRVEALEERLGFVSENLARLIDLEPRIQRRADEVQQQFRSSDLAAPDDGSKQHDLGDRARAAG